MLEESNLVMLANWCKSLILINSLCANLVVALPTGHNLDFNFVADYNAKPSSTPTSKQHEADHTDPFLQLSLNTANPLIISEYDIWQPAMEYRPFDLNDELEYPSNRAPAMTSSFTTHFESLDQDHGSHCCDASTSNGEHLAKPHLIGKETMQNSKPKSRYQRKRPGPGKVDTQTNCYKQYVYARNRMIKPLQDYSEWENMLKNFDEEALRLREEFRIGQRAKSNKYNWMKRLEKNPEHVEAKAKLSQIGIGSEMIAESTRKKDIPVESGDEDNRVISNSLYKLRNDIKAFLNGKQKSVARRKPNYSAESLRDLQMFRQEPKQRQVGPEAERILRLIADMRMTFRENPRDKDLVEMSTRLNDWMRNNKQKFKPIHFPFTSDLLPK